VEELLPGSVDLLPDLRIRVTGFLEQVAVLPGCGSPLARLLCADRGGGVNDGQGEASQWT